MEYQYSDPIHYDGLSEQRVMNAMLPMTPSWINFTYDPGPIVPVTQELPQKAAKGPYCYFNALAHDAGPLAFRDHIRPQLDYDPAVHAVSLPQSDLPPDVPVVVEVERKD